MDAVRAFKELSKTRLKGIRAGDRDDQATLQQVQHQVAIDFGYLSWATLLNAPEVDRQLALLMDREPHLNRYGFGAGPSARTVQERLDNMVNWRAELRVSAGHVAKIGVWLVENVEARQTINTSVGSYGLKHLAESDLGGYVANGELIAAAILAGYSYRRNDGTSPNAVFAMSSRSITALRRRPRP